MVQRNACNKLLKRDKFKRGFAANLPLSKALYDGRTKSAYDSKWALVFRVGKRKNNR